MLRNNISLGQANLLEIMLNKLNLINVLSDTKSKLNGGTFFCYLRIIPCLACCNSKASQDFLGGEEESLIQC
jgi:hypothetical protein